MFSRKSCYFFVRPKRSYLEVVVFLGRTVKAPQIRNVVDASKVKRAHILRIVHRDEVEAPVTDWLREAYDLSGRLAKKPAHKTNTKRTKTNSARGSRTRSRSS